MQVPGLCDLHVGLHNKGVELLFIRLSIENNVIKNSPCEPQNSPRAHVHKDDFFPPIIQSSPHEKKYF